MPAAVSSFGEANERGGLHEVLQFGYLLRAIRRSNAIEFTPMIIVRLMGGLGNQMFQYAAGLRLATQHQTRLKLDLTFLLDRSPRENFTYRDFDLVIFGFPTEIATAAEVRRFRRLAPTTSRSMWKRAVNTLGRRHYYLETNFAFDPRVLELPGHTYLEGYFQSERYFADIAAEIRRRFCLETDEKALPSPTRRLADEIRTENGICMNVRRGDYVTIPSHNRFHGVCPLEYFVGGLSELRGRGATGRGFVFSDDVEWCRDNFGNRGDLTIVGEEHAGPRFSTKLWLMSLCRHFVIPNSSFGWWAAWLARGEHKMVVSPLNWLANPNIDTSDLIPPDWIRI